MEIKKIFDSAQNGSTTKVVYEKLKKIWKNLDIDNIKSAFEDCLIRTLDAPKNSPYATKALTFLTEFVVSDFFWKNEPSNDSNQFVAVNTDGFCFWLLNKLLSLQRATNVVHRFRIIKLISGIIQLLPENIDIDDDLYSKIRSCLLERLKDSSIEIRTCAAESLVRFQTLSELECPVMEALMHHLSNDVCHHVRKVIVKNLRITSCSLEAILQSMIDIKKEVRIAAIERISLNIGINYLTIDQRIFIIKKSMDDPEIKNQFFLSLISKWLKESDDSLEKLLNYFDVENETEVCEKFLFSYFERCNVEQFKTNIDEITSFFDNDVNLIKPNKLSMENSFLWNCLIEYKRKISDQLHLDSLICEPTSLCKYIKAFHDSKIPNIQDDEDSYYTSNFTLKQLINILQNFGNMDEAGRKSSLNLLVYLIQSPKILMEYLAFYIDSFHKLNLKAKTSLEKLVDCMSELRNPLRTLSQKSADLCSQKEIFIEDKLKAAEYRMNIMRYKQQLEDAVKHQDFDSAAQFKASLKDLENQYDLLMNPPLSLPQPNFNDVMSQATDTIDVRSRCLVIFQRILCFFPCSFNQNPILKAQFDNLVIPSIVHEAPDIRLKAIPCLAYSMLYNKDLSKQYFVLVHQISLVDCEQVQVVALKLIFDMLLIYGCECFLDETETINANANGDADALDKESIDEPMKHLSISNNQQVTSAVSKMLNQFINRIDTDDSIDVKNVIVEGLTKLFIHGRLFNDKVLSRLIIIWFDPPNKTNYYLTHCLGTFFPIFADKSIDNKLLFNDCLFITLKELSSVSLSSTLSEIKLYEIGDFFIKITSNRATIDQSDNNTNSSINIHDQLFIKISNHIMNNPNCSYVGSLVHMIVRLNLSFNDESVMSDCYHLLKKVEKSLKEKLLIKSINKFCFCISSKYPNLLELIEEEPESPNDQHNQPSHKTLFSSNKSKSMLPNTFTTSCNNSSTTERRSKRIKK